MKDFALVLESSRYHHRAKSRSSLLTWFSSMLLPKLVRQPRTWAARNSGVTSGDMMISETLIAGVS